MGVPLLVVVICVPLVCVCCCRRRHKKQVPESPPEREHWLHLHTVYVCVMGSKDVIIVVHTQEMCLPYMCVHALTLVSAIINFKLECM